MKAKKNEEKKKIKKSRFALHPLEFSSLFSPVLKTYVGSKNYGKGFWG